MYQTRTDYDKQTKLIVEMRSHIYGNWRTCVTYVFAELNIADYLSDSPKDIHELSSLSDTNSKALARFLRCASGLGFTKRDSATGKYSITTFGALLSSDHPQSQRNAARLNGAPYRYEPWGRLLETIRDGDCRNVSPTYLNGSLDYLADKPECLEVFQKAMTELSAEQNEALALAYDFSSYKHVVDIGCGQGSFLKAILRLNESLRGIMFDLELTLNTETSTDDTSLFNRLSRENGDFFKEVPSGCDLYIIKNVIHNWPEEKAEKLLKTIYAGMTACGDNVAVNRKRLLIIENIIPEGDENNLAVWLDLNFVALVDGAERTLEEYRTLSKKAGFAISNLFTTPVGRHIIELKVM
ncbi:MAG: methyltransferase [Gallionellaceae bacterium]